MSCSRGDLVLLPIPFTDLSSRKVRPAIVIGFGSFPGDLFVVPLTSPLASAEFTLADWQPAGLNVPSGIKAQLATVESALVQNHRPPLLRRLLHARHAPVPLAAVVAATYMPKLSLKSVAITALEISLAGNEHK